MNRILSRTSISGFAMAAALSLSSADVAAQTTFTACRVPVVGAIYMIGLPGLPTACLDPAHVEFSWTEGGVPADGSITGAQLADDAVTSVNATERKRVGIVASSIAGENMSSWFQVASWLSVRPVAG